MIGENSGFEGKHNGGANNIVGVGMNGNNGRPDKDEIGLITGS